jgi:hypothetical protein
MGRGNLRIVAALAALALLAGCAPKESPPRKGKVSAEIADTGPRLVGNPPTVQIELPPRMTQVLAEDDTSYSTLSPFDFVSDIVNADTTGGAWAYEYDGRQAPFPLIADFDGDGRDDVALLQRSPARGRVIAVFDVIDAPRLVFVTSWDRMRSGDAGKSGYYLSRFRAGPYKVPDFAGSGDTTSTVTIAHESIEVSNYGKTATTYYWTGENFESVTTGD